MTGPAEREALYDAFAHVGKALSNGKRLELLELLAQGERSVEALAHAADIRLTSVSAHLQILKQAGVVTTRREGARIHYGLAGDDIATLFGLLQQVARAHLADAEHARAAYLGPTDTVPLTRRQLLDRMTSTNVRVIDVRPTQEYTAGHIPGACSVPLDELACRLDELPDDAEVVAYGRSANCVLAHDAVRLLTARGHRALRLTDGILEWRVARLPIEPGLNGAATRPTGGYDG
ncbi:metalloregulator ArsR/SmtB family transcription factor [Streptomyces sp. S.PB5]|uniref:ArsR/SmtB family transcription factor n=1 Tax=Streptomyces sp. S.PB5 TaxID=3020844 RepID=UPI0025AFE065|nr:metalloregulator ArsR/SmtB family transcription factor [Streptomyces sp. S.PB5]MDN3028589.1 metalloregulator ArsR/SmtB family transcription factor [Streptomyces sp. S.PB5]